MYSWRQCTRGECRNWHHQQCRVRMCKVHKKKKNYQTQKSTNMVVPLHVSLSYTVAKVCFLKAASWEFYFHCLCYKTYLISNRWRSYFKTNWMSIRTYSSCQWIKTYWMMSILCWTTTLVIRSFEMFTFVLRYKTEEYI